MCMATHHGCNASNMCTQLALHLAASYVQVTVTCSSSWVCLHHGLAVTKTTRTLHPWAISALQCINIDQPLLFACHVVSLWLGLHLAVLGRPHWSVTLCCVPLQAARTQGLAHNTSQVMHA